MNTDPDPTPPEKGRTSGAGSNAAATPDPAALQGELVAHKDRYLRLAAGPNRLREEDIRQIGEHIKSVETPFNLIPEFQNLRI